MRSFFIHLALFIFTVTVCVYATGGGYYNTVPYPPFTTFQEYDPVSNPEICFTGQIIDTTDLRTGDVDSVDVPLRLSIDELNEYFLEPSQEFIISYNLLFDYTWRFMDSVTILKIDTNTLQYNTCGVNDSIARSEWKSMYNSFTSSDYTRFDSVQFVYIPQELSFSIGNYIKGVNYFANRGSMGDLKYLKENGDSVINTKNYDVSFRGEFEISDQPIPLHSDPITKYNTPKYYTRSNQQLQLQNSTSSTAKYTLINAQGQTLFQQRLSPGAEQIIRVERAQLMWLRVESAEGVDVSVVRGF